MRLTDTRRLTGPSLVLDRPGAVGEAVDLDDTVSGPVLTLWRRFAHELLQAVGWDGERVAVRPYPRGASLAVSAPIDGLYAATDLIERAWEMTEAALTGGSADGATIVAALTKAVKDDADPRLVALARAAAERGATFLAGEGQVSIGLGARGQLWPDDAVPNPGAVNWDTLGDIPVAMVTGTNGKSTTVRLTAAIAAAAGSVAGQSSSDWVRVGDRIIDTGDYSGPSGARQAARDPRTEIAVLETARGGLMRRGLALPHADVCLITNVAADHLGDYGIVDVPTLADAKFFIASALRPGGRLVLNADDPELAKRGARHGGDIAWFSLEPEAHGLDAWVAAGGAAAFLRDGWMMLARDREVSRVLEVNAFPLGMKGAARFNIANALGAICLADALGLPVEAMRKGLAGFTGSPDENPGRGNFVELGGVTAVVDFAHNPHGVSAFLGALAAMPATRRAVLIGQAGDRSDADTAEMTRVIWESGPDLVVVKELPGKLRGRKLGEMPAVIAAELRRLGAPEETIALTANEIEATRHALEWAQPGDMLVLLIHEDRRPVMELLSSLQDRAWQPGQPLDAPA
jgi:UDP-N-acetylmuramyl tripeptide synthase